MAARDVLGVLRLSYEGQAHAFDNMRWRKRLAIWLLIACAGNGEASTTLNGREVALSNIADDLGKTGGAASLLSSGLTLILIVAAAVVIYALVRISREIKQMRAAEEAQAARFEASILATFGTANLAESDVGEQDGDATPVPLTQNAILTETNNANGDLLSEPLHHPVDRLSRQIVAQLREAGLLQEIESFIPLHGNPKGAAILKLRNRKRVLLVPYYESEVFTERELTKYDGIIFLSRSGRGLFVQTLEAVITEHFR